MAWYCEENKGTLILIFQKGARTNPGNYRPICLLDNRQKKFCRQVLDKLKTLVTERRILSEF